MDPDRGSVSPTSGHRTIRTEEPLQNNLNLTFISIHDLSPEARILYSSESIIDVLGYTPDEVVNRSAWDFFAAEELPHAKRVHQQGIEMDKAAMLAYCRIKDRQGQWVGVESCFTIVHDVIVVCTSIYSSGLPSQKRALDAPVIRRLFTSSPKDPRYHMLSHISCKFQQPRKAQNNEPRAALFLNRFTRTLTIMYATTGIEDIIGIPSSALQGKSFYYCIAENCLSDAVRCLENAKGNDSIAYLRFWFRNPLQVDSTGTSTAGGEESDEEMTTDTSVDQEMSGGVTLGHESSSGDASSTSNAVRSDSEMEVDRPSDENDPQSRTSSGDSTTPADTHEGIFGTTRPRESSASSAAESPSEDRGRNGPIELEAVISCASDGLVVCLRRARPMIPQPTQRPSTHTYENGLFAAPWADEPIVPNVMSRPQFENNTPFAPALGPQGAQRHPPAVGGPDRNDFMAAIREQAIFAWALTGINGTLHKYAAGSPRGESVPHGGLPIWQNDSLSDSGSTGSSAKHVDSMSSSTVNADANPPVDSRANSNADMAIGNDHRGLFGDPGLKHTRKSSTQSHTPSSHSSVKGNPG
ncbi:hypothetical protein K461DRAFT_269330 [Myriangium duriaei CBS 260.36]|uniref:PAS domain-containing protein n=1 Tax=Myriangium duriaei CBS 260.36 TaxID=1168546 RepID=A0A9P4IWQ3_9PEZI|nr:hypothetical protein K461DRAFT_269330 [Myriangium duriaei CBS 260.36]